MIINYFKIFTVFHHFIHSDVHKYIPHVPGICPRNVDRE